MKQRLEAIAARGKACISLASEIEQPDGETMRQFCPAGGERLKQTDMPGAFETLDRARQFRLRSCKGKHLPKACAS